MCIRDSVHAQCSGLGAWFLNEEITPRTGNRSQYFAPSGVYPTRDGRNVVITCPSEKFFRNLAGAFGESWADDPRFSTIDARLANQEELDAVVSDACRRFDREELVERLVAADVLTAPIKEIQEVADDVQVRHNGMIAATEHAILGSLEVTACPIKLGGSPAAVRRSPPVHGQHTEELLAELGYDAASCLLYTSPSPRDATLSRMPSSA